MSDPAASAPEGQPGADGASGADAADGAPRVLLDLLAARGPSGYESAPAEVWREAASEFAKVSTDVVGTPLALVEPKHGYESASQRLLVMGHIDEIGLIVTHIDDEGYLWFRGVGVGTGGAG
jgi:putative aminopeptidase FrvX